MRVASELNMKANELSKQPHPEQATYYSGVGITKHDDGYYDKVEQSVNAQMS